MFESFLAALIISIIAIIPVLIKQDFTTALTVGIGGTIIFTLINYFACPTFAGFVPFTGGTGTPYRLPCGQRHELGSVRPGR